MFTSKTIVDLTQPKLKTIQNVHKHEKMDKITTTFCFGCGIPSIVIKSNQFK